MAEENARMLSAGCFFRGNCMTREAARQLLHSATSHSDIEPHRWGVCEPFTTPFDRQNLDQIVDVLVPAREKDVRGLVFLARDSKPRTLTTIRLVRGFAHNIVPNSVKTTFDDEWPGNAQRLPEHLARIATPGPIDFAYVADSSPADEKFFEELLAPYTVEEIQKGVRRAPPFVPERRKNRTRRLWFDPDVSKMIGPNGYLWDVVWYNYFGPIYVEFIGKDRLVNAGWERVDELGGGLACYATISIDDPKQLEKRARIRSALEEFYWTRGCKREDKRAPVFDFTEQLKLLDPETQLDPRTRHVFFAGFNDNEIQQFEQATGMHFDRDSGTMSPDA